MRKLGTTRWLKPPLNPCTLRTLLFWFDRLRALCWRRETKAGLGCGRCWHRSEVRYRSFCSCSSEAVIWPLFGDSSEPSYRNSWKLRPLNLEKSYYSRNVDRSQARDYALCLSVLELIALIHLSFAFCLYKLFWLNFYIIFNADFNLKIKLNVYGFQKLYWSPKNLCLSVDLAAKFWAT